jgi:hypothetical protein
LRYYTSRGAPLGYVVDPYLIIRLSLANLMADLVLPEALCAIW